MGGAEQHQWGARETHQARRGAILSPPLPLPPIVLCVKDVHKLGDCIHGRHVSAELTLLLVTEQASLRRRVEHPPDLGFEVKLQ